MAHFAKIENNFVIQVVVVPDEQEHRGQEFLADDLGLGGTWIQTSYNSNIRGKFAGVGDSYDPEADLFIAPEIFVIEPEAIEASSEKDSAFAKLEALGLTAEEIAAITGA